MKRTTYTRILTITFGALLIVLFGFATLSGTPVHAVSPCGAHVQTPLLCPEVGGHATLLSSVFFTESLLVVTLIASLGVVYHAVFKKSLADTYVHIRHALLFSEDTLRKRIRKIFLRNILAPQAP